MAQVRAALAFLEGTTTRIMEELEQSMAAASEALAFERAAGLRNKLEALRWLREQLDWVQQVRQEHSFLYPEVGVEGRSRWYLVHGGRVEKVVLAPSSAASRREAVGAIKAVYQSKRRPLGLAAAEEVEAMLLVAGWFRRHPQERARTMSPSEALRRVAGGG
jgi:excinuclease UvrABC nuclease subunit